MAGNKGANHCALRITNHCASSDARNIKGCPFDCPAQFLGAGRSLVNIIDSDKSQPMGLLIRRERNKTAMRFAAMENQWIVGLARFSDKILRMFDLIGPSQQCRIKIARLADIGG